MQKDTEKQLKHLVDIISKLNGTLEHCYKATGQVVDILNEAFKTNSIDAIKYKTELSYMLFSLKSLFAQLEELYKNV